MLMTWKERCCANHCMCKNPVGDMRGSSELCEVCDTYYKTVFRFFKQEDLGANESCISCCGTSSEFFVRYACGHFVCCECFYVGKKVSLGKGLEVQNFDTEYFQSMSEAERVAFDVSTDMQWRRERPDQYRLYMKTVFDFQNEDEEDINRHFERYSGCSLCTGKGLSQPISASEELDGYLKFHKN